MYCVLGLKWGRDPTNLGFWAHMGPNGVDHPPGISIFGAKWGHMGPLGSHGAVGPVGPVGPSKGRLVPTLPFHSYVV